MSDDMWWQDGWAKWLTLPFDTDFLRWTTPPLPEVLVYAVCCVADTLHWSLAVLLG